MAFAWYIAAMFPRQEEMQDVRQSVIDTGHEVCARWVTEENDMQKMGTDQEKVDAALLDLTDVTKCDGIIFFSETWDCEREGNITRGGRHVEFGLALALNKRVVVVGPRENIFHYLPGVEVYEDLDSFLAQLEEESEMI